VSRAPKKKNNIMKINGFFILLIFTSISCSIACNAGIVGQLRSIAVRGRDIVKVVRTVKGGRKLFDKHSAMPEKSKK